MADNSLTTTQRSGARLLLDALQGHGCERAFGVPGESYLDVLDVALDFPNIPFITTRHESGAAFMAEAYGKLTGKPGVAFVSRGPGLCNATIGVHTAQQDSTPMLLLVGLGTRGNRYRDSFQEVDINQLFGGMAKWTADVNDAARVPEFIARAHQIAVSGRPGPVVLGLPEDMLRDMADVPDCPPVPRSAAYPDPVAMERLAGALKLSKAPLLLVGGSDWTDDACAQIRAFAEASAIPTVAAFRRQDVLDNESPCYIGDLGLAPNPKLVDRVRGADLIIVVGARLNDATTQGFKLLDHPLPQQALVHFYPGPEELGRLFRPDIAVACSSPAAAVALAALPPVESPPWAAWCADARADYQAWALPDTCVGDVDLGAIFGWLRERLPADCIVTSDAGNFAGWPQRHLLYRRPGRQISAISGAMGYGVPAAVAAKLAHPRRVVVGFCGDGGFMMTGQEMATARLYGVAPIIFVINNGQYGTIRMHQERRFPGRVSATQLANPDFAALAKAYGCFGATVTRTEEFVSTFWDAMWSRQPAIIELQVDPEQLSTRQTLTGIRGMIEVGPPKDV